jgi:glycerol dehydrogenase-like iron-containing ADH family enzyme
MVSHTLDMMSSVDKVPHDLHGRQVGVGTILASELYARVLAIESPNFSKPRISVDRAFWGHLTGNVADQYAQKSDRLQQAADVLSQGEAWDSLRTGIAPLLRPPSMIRDCLRAADAAFRAEDIGCSRERLLTAFLHAHEIRSRFTILDLAFLCGVLPGAAGEIVEAWG